MNIKFLCGVFFLFAGMELVSAQSEKAIKGNTPSVHYIGRTAVNNDSSVSFDWSGTYLRTILTGGKLALRVSDTGLNYYNVFVDSILHRVVTVTGQDTLIQFVSGIDKKPHHIVIQKRTEGEAGTTTVHQFILPSKGKLEADCPRKRFIEFYGNSLTCGFGTEGKDRSEPFKKETENCNLSYASIIARYFDADYALIAHSGQGMARNYGDSVRVSTTTMKDRMLNTFDLNLKTKWNFNDYRPDLVVINLGTNDFSTEPTPHQDQFVHAYKTALNQLREKYGNIPILCVCPPIRQRQIVDFMEGMYRELNDPNLYLTILPPGLYNDTTDLGSAWHPNNKGQQKMAMPLIPYISTIKGWPMRESNMMK